MRGSVLNPFGLAAGAPPQAAFPAYANPSATQGGADRNAAEDGFIPVNNAAPAQAAPVRRLLALVNNRRVCIM